MMDTEDKKNLPAYAAGDADPEQDSGFYKPGAEESILPREPDVTDDELWDVLEFASLAEYLRAQDGLDTRLESQAANLSGGQRQRLALARALLANSPVYIFDEATSNIDVESEEHIMAALRRLARYKAVVVITHRLANVVDAKELNVLDRGWLVGYGTHEELLERCDAYRALWESQQELERYGREARNEA